MNRFANILHLFLMGSSLLAGTACMREDTVLPPVSSEGRENVIAFTLAGPTRVAEVTELDSFNVIAATGTPGSESDYWGGSVTATLSGERYLTARYWAASDPGLSAFYASNAALAFSAAGPTVTVDGNADIVCAHLADPDYNTVNALAFRHILSRIGTVTVNTQEGYAISDISATLLAAVTAGTYNLRTQAWSGLSAGGNIAVSASETGSENDIWVIPGTYTIRVSYTLSKGSYDEDFTKDGIVVLESGLINGCSIDAVGGNASEEQEPYSFETDFGDTEAQDVLITSFDSNGDGVLSAEEIGAVTSLGYVFRGNTSVTEVDLRAFTNLSEIAVADFFNCTNLTTVILPEGLTVIHRNAFKNCSSLTDVTVPSTVTTIECSAFYGCSSLEEIVLPAALTTVDAQVFSRCTSLVSITVNASTPPSLTKSNSNGGTVVAGDWFYKTPVKSGTGHIYVPAASVSDYKSATNWSTVSSVISAKP